MVSELHTGIHMLSQLNTNLEDMIVRLNEHLNESLIVGKFITLFAARIHPDANRIDYVVAGHPPPFLISKDGEAKELESEGMALGITADARLQQKTQAIKPGDLLFSFSDGYSEARNPDGALFEETRLKKIVVESVMSPLREIRNKLDNAIIKFTENAPPPDDATLVLMRRI